MKRVSSILAVLSAVTTVVLRLVPHPLNFSSVGGMGLFGGARLRSWQPYALAVFAMIVSDLGLWLLTGMDRLYAPWHVSRLYVYPCVAGYVAIGAWLCRDASWSKLVGASLLGSLQFFVVTNFCAWLVQPLEGLPPETCYTRDLAGLLSCFAAAIPFFQADFPWDLHAIVMKGDPRYGVFATFLGDLVFTCGWFGIARILEGKPVEDAAAAEPVSAGAGV